MKKNLFKNVAFAAIAGLALTACNKQQPQVEDKTQAPAAASQLKIAYVEVDSIMTQYTFAKEYSSLLQNAYTREQAEAIQAGLQKQQADLQGLQQRLGNEFQAETEKYNKALHDSIANYLKVYNKDKKYSLIFSKQGDNLLYADKAYDVTAEVVAGLNKAYKGSAKK